MKTSEQAPFLRGRTELLLKRLDKRNGACGVWENAVKERVQSKSSEHH